MRRILSITIIAALTLAVLTSAISKSKKGKQFRGKITYSISYESENFTALEISKMPTEQTIIKYDNMSMFNQTTPQGIITFISNPETDQNMILLEAGLKKAAIITSYAESKAKQDSAREFTTEIDFSEDTKIIAGYTCNKATVTYTPMEGVEAEERMFNVFYSPKLGSLESNIGTSYEGINGELLEFYEVTSEIIIKTVATEIKKGKVKDLDFFLPDDYKVFDNQEDLVKFFSGE